MGYLHSHLRHGELQTVKERKSCGKRNIKPSSPGIPSQKSSRVFSGYENTENARSYNLVQRSRDFKAGKNNDQFRRERKHSSNVFEVNNSCRYVFTLGHP